MPGSPIFYNQFNSLFMSSFGTNFLFSLHKKLNQFPKLLQGQITFTPLRFRSLFVLNEHYFVFIKIKPKFFNFVKLSKHWLTKVCYYSLGILTAACSIKIHVARSLKLRPLSKMYITLVKIPGTGANPNIYVPYILFERPIYSILQVWNWNCKVNTYQIRVRVDMVKVVSPFRQSNISVIGK